MNGWRIARGLVTASVLLSALLAAGIIYRFHTELVALVLLLIVAGAAVWLAMPALGRRKLAIGALLVLAMLNLLLVVPELALRLCDYRYESGIQFGYPRPSHFVRFVPDAELFWRLPSSMPGVNSLGFPGREVRVPKPKGAFRCLFLGDSCTTLNEGFGYPSVVEEQLRDAPELAGRRFESAVLAVSGYSSHQGRVLAERYAPELEPDLAFVYFGWNDHWAAYGAVDAEKKVAERGRLASLLEGPRVLQGVREVADRLRGANRPLGEVRVPIRRYEENLLAIARELARREVPLVFITAPSAHARLGVPDYLIEMHFAGDAASVLALHRAYNDVVRAVAASTGAGLLDLAAEVDALQSLDGLFLSDGIHFTGPGLRWVASRVTAKVLETCAPPSGD